MNMHHSKLTRSDAGNCWIYGCATVPVLGIVGVIVAVFGVKYMINQGVEKFTAETPVEMAKVEATEEEQTGTIERYDAWMNSLESDEGAEVIKLSQKDINILIQNHPEFSEFSDYMYVTIEGSEIQGDVSVPLDGLGIDMLNGRYFNGSLKLEMYFSDGYLEIYVKDASLNGEAVDEVIMNGVSVQNLAEESNNDPEMQETFERFESIEIVDGELIITPKALSDMVESDEEPEMEETDSAAVEEANAA